MKITKYNHIKAGQVKASSILSGGGGSSSTTIERSSFELDRTIWGQEDKGEDIDGSMTVNGDINIKVIVPLGEEEDDGDGEYEEYEEGGGNLNVEEKITSKTAEVKEDLTVGRHLYINHSHDKHDAKKQCVGEIFNLIEEEIEKLKKKLLPIGTVIMFNGTLEKIPNGWAICDGNNGTPNLTNKFIRASNTAGLTGGSNNVNLTDGNLPSHTHTIDIKSVVNKNNVVDTAYTDKLVPALDELYENSYDLGGGDHYVFETGYHNKSDKGLVGIKVGDLIGASTTVDTTATIGTTGDGTGFEIVPEYYTLLFIMKISE